MNLDLFTKGYLEVKAIKDFIDSEVGQYLSVVYGPLHYTSDPTINFLNVHKDKDNNYVISEAVWVDKFPDTPKTGSIIPQTFLHEKFSKNHTGGEANHISKALSESGIAFVSQETPPEEFESISSVLFTEKINGGVHTPVEYETERVKKANTEHIIKEIEPFIETWHKRTCHDIKKNILVKKMIHGGHVQKMTRGAGLSPHTDADRGEPFMLSKLHWIFNSSKRIKGRELSFGRRSNESLKSFIETCLSSSDLSASHSTINEFEEYGSMAPCLLTKVYVGCWNPLFYHAVSDMISNTEVITVIEDYSTSECT